MHSTFMGVEIGRRGMSAHQTALNTTGHNVTNLSTEGYSRQRVKITTLSPLYDPAYDRSLTKGQLGQGPITAQVERVFDVLHENQLLSAGDDLGYWKARDSYLVKLEQIYSEPNETSVRTYMDKFWTSWQDLANNPESLSTRVVVAQTGQALVEAINHRYDALTEQRALLNDDVKATVASINDKTASIAALNNTIAQVRALGDEPNDLLDKRDLMVGQLAELVPLTVTHRDIDEFQIHVDGRTLVQGVIAHPLTLAADLGNDGMSAVHWGEKDPVNDLFFSTGGKLGSLIELRDKDVKEEIRKIDAAAINFSDMVNDLHGRGYGKNGETGEAFFNQLPIIEDVNGNYDQNGDGQVDSTYLFRLTGANKLPANRPVGMEGLITLSGRGNDTVRVPYTASDTAADIVARINYSGSDVTARIDSNGALSLKGALSADGATPDFVVRHVEDSGAFLAGYAGLLTASGPDGAYDYARTNAAQASLRIDAGVSFATTPLRRPSGWLAVNPRVTEDPNRIAATMVTASGEAAVGDGRMALAISDLRHEKVMVDRLTSMDDFFADSAAVLGSKGQEARDTHSAYDAIVKNLQDIKQSISGVNINEEFADLVKFQHGFEASAKFISTSDKLLDIIINRLLV